MWLAYSKAAVSLLQPDTVPQNQNQAPTYLYKRITDQLSILETRDATSRHYNYKTRQEASGALRQVPGAVARLDLAERSWCWRAAKTYHTLPVGIKNLVKQAKFKEELKAWVMKNVEP